MSMSELHKPEWYGEYAVIKISIMIMFKWSINAMEQEAYMTMIFSLVLT